MTPRERFIAALERRPLTGRVPHFELIFYLTMEAFGKVHPDHRDYSQWIQMQESERQAHRQDMADLHIAIAERYEHSAIFLRPNPRNVEETLRLVDLIREKTGDRYCLLRGGDATFGLSSGKELSELVFRMADEPDRLKAQAQRQVDDAIARAEQFARHGGIDGLALNADYCTNRGPFIGPAQFAEFILPYLVQLVTAYRQMGFYVIKHTDGNVMPILDQLVECRPHAIHSLDPQAGVDLAEVKRRYGDRVCLIGNVNCGLLDRGTDEEVVTSARYALRHGMPGGGYIYSSSNVIYTGLRLSQYELMLNVWREEGNYD
jgi:uroporphyrinogen decarboxylase